ncbi:MAG: DJ-1/PfpI family protein [Myxococcales bacterium]|nr:DJ-1/PfpI family protein [Myxococcales bacterium]
MLTVGIFVFDEVEVLDFAGPFEVFSTASRVRAKAGAVPFRTVTIAKSPRPVRSRGGLQIQPHHWFGEHPHLDVVIVPGGDVAAELRDDSVIRWIAATATAARLTASVCTGAFLLAAAGILDGKRATTHWEDIDELRQSYPRVKVTAGPRWIEEGDVVTSAGISAGVDMSLHVVRRLADAHLAAATARQMDYDWRDGGAAAEPGVTPDGASPRS